MIAPFDPATFPEKFHMGAYSALFGVRRVHVAFVLPCEPSDQFPGFFEVFKTAAKAQAWLSEWSEAFDAAQCHCSEFRGSYVS